jgi:uncharacterized repeat protein (TIGR01451 family)
VGEDLYLAVGTTFIKYDPVTKGETALAPAPEFRTSDCAPEGIGFEPWGGLQPYQGKIYGHQGNECDGFAVYDIAANEWTVLPALPENAVLGSAIDPETGAYYAYGGYGGSTFMRYDIAAGAWSATASPFNETIWDGGMAYVSLPEFRGVYVIEGEKGTAFYRYTPQADVALTKRASAATIVLGSQITYTIRATDNGPLAAANVLVTDPLPSNVNLVSASSTQGSCSGSATLECSLGTLASGGSARITVTVTTTATGTATNAASVTSETPDPEAANNSASASTAVVPQPPAAPVTPPASTPAPSPASAAALPPLLPPRWVVPRGGLRAVHGVVSARLINPNGQLTLSGAAQLMSYVAAGRARKPVLLARSTVRLAAGATKPVHLHLSRAALAKLKLRHKLRVRVLLVLTDQFGRRVKPTGVYLLSISVPKHKAKSKK